jgi:hypothetical protein
VRVVGASEVLSSNTAERRGDPCLEPNDASEGFCDLTSLIPSDLHYVQPEWCIVVIEVRLVRMDAWTA